MVPIFKSKGDVLDGNNYRGIKWVLLNLIRKYGKR